MIIQKIFRLIRREIPQIHLLLSRGFCLSIFEIENIANSLFIHLNSPGDYLNEHFKGKKW